MCVYMRVCVCVCVRAHTHVRACVHILQLTYNKYITFTLCKSCAWYFKKQFLKKRTVLFLNIHSLFVIDFSLVHFL